MADETGIEWTDRTYNPWIGCTKVSPGCAHCYAETFSLDKRWLKKWGPGDRLVTRTANEPEKWNLEAVENKTRYTVFCASLADVFEEHRQLPPLRADLWRLVARTPYLDWMILTKRAENIAKMLPEDWGDGYPNVCLMVSVENQKYFDERVAALRKVPARYRALSVEPLLGRIDMPAESLKGIDLVIVGGESGAMARPMNPDWVRAVRDACKRADVRLFFKQWGLWTPDHKFAAPDLANAAVFAGDTDEPRYLNKIEVGERKRVVQDNASRVVYQAGSKKTTGARIDGVEYKDHIFLHSRQSTVAHVPAAPLTGEDKRELARLEAVVARGFAAFWAVGQALREIRNRGLYRSSHTTFEAYCRERWEMSRSEAFRQIGAAGVVEVLQAAKVEVLPQTVSQTRPLLALRSPHHIRRAWEKVEASTGGAITAKTVAAAAESVMRASKRPRRKKPDDSPGVSTEAVEYPAREQLRVLLTQLRQVVGDRLSHKAGALMERISKSVDSLRC